jgi:uncharacterized repeat protein (TIGR04138 family)
MWAAPQTISVSCRICTPRGTLIAMPPDPDVDYEKLLQTVIDEVGTYPAAAYHFVQAGLNHTVIKLHGPREETKEGTSRHVSGQQLSEGLRDYALEQWGLLARTVLVRWNVTSTYDFGRIVFAMVDSGLMQKTDDDSIEDFRNVYDFKTAFDAAYRIEIKA